MSLYKGRPKVIFRGAHPVLPMLEKYLRAQGFVFIEDEGVSTQELDLIIYGAFEPAMMPSSTNVPTLVLSSYEVFNYTKTPEVILETTSVSIQPYNPDINSSLSCLHNEYVFMQSDTPSLVVRLFPIFGPEAPPNLVSRLVDDALEGKIMPQLDWGNRVRTYLHMDDALHALELLCYRLLRGTEGLFNLGSTSPITVQNLAKSVWQIAGLDSKTMVEESFVRRAWRPMLLVPDMARTQAIIKYWSPTYSIRTGLAHWLIESKSNTSLK